MNGRYSTEEQALYEHQREAKMVTVAAGVIAKMDNQAWYTNRINLNDRGGNGKRKPHYSADSASRQYWRSIGREAAWKLNRQLDMIGGQYLPPYKVIVWYSHRHPMDRDSVNASPVTKAIVDGLVWGGLFPDDNNRWVIGQDSRLLKTDGYQVEIMVQVLAYPHTPNKETDDAPVSERS